MPLRTLVPILRSLHCLHGPHALAEPADRLLLERFVKDGDAGAFELLLRRHSSLVLGVCRRLLRDRHDAEDAFQATFLVLVRKARSLREPDRLGPWLYGVACRIARKAHALPSRATPSAGTPADGFSRRAGWTTPLCATCGRCSMGIRSGSAAVAATASRWCCAVCKDSPRSRPPASSAVRRARSPPGSRAAPGVSARPAWHTSRRFPVPPGTLAAVLVPVPASATSPALLALTRESALQLLRSGITTPLFVTLLEGVQNAMLLHKWKVVLTVVLLGLVGIGLGAYRAPADVGPPVAASPSLPTEVRVESPARDEVEEAESSPVRTANFTVTAPTHRMARLIAEAAERERKAQAMRHQLGKELPNWRRSNLARSSSRLPFRAPLVPAPSPTTRAKCSPGAWLSRAAWTRF